MKTFFLALLLVTTFSLLGESPGDPSASYPPNVYGTEGGTAPMYTAASAEASHWIALMDVAAYAGAWQDAGPLFHDIIQQDQWVAAMRALRRPLGLVRTRKVIDHKASESLPGGTRGYFMTIRYETNFSSKTGAIEIVVLMMIRNDQWRVISYSFK